jgi:glycosyltransferase involved in cell wall biosynthesis
MQILHVVRSLRPETGGVAEAVRQLAGAQQGRGDQVVIVSLDPADSSDKSVVVLGRASHGYGRSPALVSWLVAHRAQFDAVIVHGLWQYQSYAVWRGLRNSATPYLVYPHGMLDVWFKRTYPLKHAKKWLYWMGAEYRVLRDAAAVCYTAEEERRRARLSFRRYRARERIAPIGIETPRGDDARERTAFGAAYPALRGRRFLLFLGRIHPKKGVELLLSAYAAVMKGSADAPLLAIAGPASEAAYQESLRAASSRQGIAESVVWLPLLSGDVKWGALRACDAFALFSHQENFGMTVVEALACGRPVLLSDQVAISNEIVADGAGLAGRDTAEGAAQILYRWQNLGETARHAMSAAARACFRRRYESERAAENLASILGEIGERR